MDAISFDYRQDAGPKDKEHLKCSFCGHEAKIDFGCSYEEQADCPACGGQMMGQDWAGWKDTPERQERLQKLDAKSKEARLKAIAESVSQETEPFGCFTREERTIRGLVVEKPGTEAPWLTPYGVGLVKIHGIRRKEGKVEFGIGNKKPPILGWVSAKDFYDEWPE